MNLVARLMIEDHQRLDGLFELAARTSGKVDLEPFGTFREGLFRHIGIEEDVLFLALSGRPGAPDEHIAKLRLEHSALRKLLVCAPSAELLIALLMIIEPHIRLEEEAGGFYDACDLLSASEVDALTEKVRAYPMVSPRCCSDTPQALAAAQRAMRRAGYDWERCSDFKIECRP